MSGRELLASGAGITLIDEQIITISGNWTKVAAVKPTDRVIVDIWSAGASGAKKTTGNFAFGGQGGSHLRLEFFAYELPSSVACIIGAGGAAVTASDTPGNDGGFSSFAGVVVPGGKGGKATTNTTDQISVAIMDTRSFVEILSTYETVSTTLGMIVNPSLPVEIGGISSYTSATGYKAQDRKMAGASGGSTNNSTLYSPGNTVLGGAGGVGAYGNGNNAGSGSIPGGGGGGKDTASSGNGNSGAGARGEIRVRVLRGAS